MSVQLLFVCDIVYVLLCVILCMSYWVCFVYVILCMSHCVCLIVCDIVYVLLCVILCMSYCVWYCACRIVCDIVHVVLCVLCMWWLYVSPLNFLGFWGLKIDWLYYLWLINAWLPSSFVIGHNNCLAHGSSGN